MPKMGEKTKLNNFIENDQFFQHLNNIQKFNFRSSHSVSQPKRGKIQNHRICYYTKKCTSNKRSLSTGDDNLKCISNFNMRKKLKTNKKTHIIEALFLYGLITFCRYT